MINKNELIMKDMILKERIKFILVCLFLIMVLTGALIFLPVRVGLQSGIFSQTQMPSTIAGVICLQYYLYLSWGILMYWYFCFCSFLLLSVSLSYGVK